MRLYSKRGATVIDAPEGHFEPGEGGGFDQLPGPVFDRLHKACVNGERLWEDEIERSARMHGEEAARRRDPESLYSSIGDLTQLTAQLARMQMGSSVPQQSPQDEAAALRRRLAELEGDAPFAAHADGTSEAPGVQGETGETTESAPKPDEVKIAPKPPARAAAKDKPPVVKPAE